MARIAPDYYLHDCVVPRTRLVEVLAEVGRDRAPSRGWSCGNVFHAGDGNLHPLIVFDRRAPGVLEKVHLAGEAIVEACVRAGGSSSGEHGIGLGEAGDAMPLVFSPADPEAQTWLLEPRLRPGRALQPGEGGLPRGGSRCADLADLPEGAWI